MGNTHSRSEDLRKRAVMSADSYIESLQEIPGYFTKTQQTIDFLEEDLSSQPRIEMSYTGPPSHLQHSRDVHPFLDRFGPNFQPKERFVDRSSHEDGEDIPASLLPGAASARELREIEVRESMASLQMQVQETLAKKREQQAAEGRPGTATGPDPPQAELAAEEQHTLEFLDSIINESMDVDFGDDSKTESGESEGSESNWIMRDRGKTPLPGLMHSTVPTAGPPVMEEDEEEVVVERRQQQPLSPAPPSSRPSSGFFRNSMYLPDSDPIHTPGRGKPPPPPTKPKPANRRSMIIAEDVPPPDYPGHAPVSPPPTMHPHSPLRILAPTRSPAGVLDASEPVDGKNSSNTSAEDMGIVADDVPSEEGSRNGDADNPYDTKSRVKGVRALVSMYSDEATSPMAKHDESFHFPPARDPFVGMQLPIRDYMLGNNNNNNDQRPGPSQGPQVVAGRVYGTMSSEDSALGDGSRDPVEDAVLGVIHSELQKLRMK